MPGAAGRGGSRLAAAGTGRQQFQGERPSAGLIPGGNTEIMLQSFRIPESTRTGFSESPSPGMQHVEAKAPSRGGEWGPPGRQRGGPESEVGLGSNPGLSSGSAPVPPCDSDPGGSGEGQDRCPLSRQAAAW